MWQLYVLLFGYSQSAEGYYLSGIDYLLRWL